MADQAEQQAARAKFTRGAFPRVPLTAAEELARTIHEVGSGEKARLISVMTTLKRAPASGPTKTLLSSANRGYGLTTGSAGDTHLALTDRGTALVTATTDYDRSAAAFEALQLNDIFRAFVEKFKHRPMPSDEVAIDYVKEASGLNEGDAIAAVKVIKQNLREFGLTETLGEREVVNPPDEVLQKLQTSSAPEQVATPRDAPDLQDRTPSDTAVASSPPALEATGDVLPQIAFNIQIQLPSDASPETYEAIFRNIAIHLLRRAAD